MQEKLIDARGLSCPEPVVLARKAMLESNRQIIRVVVDDEASIENIQRMAQSAGWSVSKQQNQDDTHLLLTPENVAADEQPAGELPERRPQIVVLIASNAIGTGDDQLGGVLMRAFIKTLREVALRPQRMICMNAGVLLTTEGSELLEDLRQLEELGVEILSCATCLDFFHRLNKLQVGRTTNMFEIAETLLNAERVVRL
jgi:selenium metabolism protein YedF